MIQEALFDTPVATHATGSRIPPTGGKPVALVEPIGTCVKCGKPAVIASPSGNPESIYCEKCGRCGGKKVDKTALGIEVKICGISVEKFVKHPRLEIWVCPCMLKVAL